MSMPKIPVPSVTNEPVSQVPGGVGVAPPETSMDLGGEAAEPQVQGDGLGVVAKEKFSKWERDDAKRFLADAEHLGSITPPFGDSESSVVIWKKPDGALWVESEYHPKSPYNWNQEYTLDLMVRAGQESSVVFERARLANPDTDVHFGRYVDLLLLPNRDMLVTATRDFFEEAADLAQKAGRHGINSVMCDLFEDYMANGWNWAEQDLSEPIAITNDGADLLSDGSLGYYPEAWEESSHVAVSPIEELIEKGRLEFRRITPSDWLDADEIRAWKEATNRYFRESQGYDDDVYPLDADA